MTADSEAGEKQPVDLAENEKTEQENENANPESHTAQAENPTAEDNGPEQELTPEVEALKQELAKISVTTPSVLQNPEIIFNPDDFPNSYKFNLPKEKLVLQYAENFRRQYVHLYRDRKPLFLNPLNECNTEKLVSTTIRTTQLQYQELYDWDGAADFVADYLHIKTLEPPYDLPRTLFSPVTVLKRQEGTCFEYSTLLVSLLIGAGYDAHVVSGYATREICLADETRDICPLLKKKAETKEEETTKEWKKYTVKPPRDLRSKFELKMEKRKQDEEAAEAAKRREEEEEKQAELEKPPPDPLHGLRIHSWVLVLAGKRDVPESFFIEPFTGRCYPLEASCYLGIESLWNHQNYWVNMQDCSEGVKGMSYDLGDCTKWEFMFPTNEKPLLLIPDPHHEEFLDEDEEEAVDDIEKHLDMPPSWVEPIHISLEDFQTRCPKGKKTKYYKRAKLEKYASYLNKDGLVSRLSSYEDQELKDLVLVKEYFEHRMDKLYTRCHNHRTGWITEYFYPGRPRCLKEHTYRLSAPMTESDRTMLFYHEARVDGLYKRLESPTEMTEEYIDRDDFLYYKYVEFGKRPKKFGPQDSSALANARPVLKMIQRFHRNKSKSAHEDVAELVFLVSEDRIQLTYHTEEKRIASSTREFIKPANWDEKGAALSMSNDMHSTFQVDPNSAPYKQVEQYLTLLDLLKSEEKSKERVRESEEEVREILNDRTREENTSELEISVYDTQRNEKAKKHRKELERLQNEERIRKQEMELDYLAPFLAKIGDPPRITKEQAFSLKEDCLGDLKMRLIDKANLIQSRFESETQELQKKQSWYQQNQVSMSKDDEEEYLNYCSEAMFRIHILELRLNRHKEMAPHKYMALEQKLRADPRLAEHF